MEVGFIYKIYKYTNLINNKIYIGQTKQSLEERADKGRNYKGSTHFYNAIQKYGWENFIGEILEEVNTIEEANEKETYYIALYDSTNQDIGYNITSGGWNSPLAEETKKILSQKAKERCKNPENNPMYGKRHSKESLEKMRMKKQGENNPMYGKHLSEESKEKIRQANRGRKIDNSYWTDEHRKEQSEFMKETAKRWCKKVLCIEDNTFFNSITEASKYYNIAVSTLSGHLHGCQHKCAGKHFKFVD